MRSQQKPIIILSVYREDTMDEINKLIHITLLNDLQSSHISAFEVEGCYKGRTEKSIVIPAEELKLANKIGKLFNQETILTLDNERGAWLTDIKTSEKQFIGFFIPVTKRAALSEDAWTKHNNQYWIVSDTRLKGHFQK